jgi:lipoate---protein ligase
VTAAYATAGEEQAWNEQGLDEPVLVPVWRYWAYRQPAVVLGCSQRALLGDAQRRTSAPVVLRGSGGGAVLAGPWMLGLSVILPSRHRLLVGSLGSSYRWLGELFARALRGAGIPADALPSDSPLLHRPADELSWACFASFSSWEVAVHGRKIVGLSQRRRQHGVLLSAGLLLALTDWTALCVALQRPAEQAVELAQRTTSCLEQIGAPAPDSLILATLASELDRVLTEAS